MDVNVNVKQSHSIVGTPLDNIRNNPQGGLVGSLGDNEGLENVGDNIKSNSINVKELNNTLKALETTLINLNNSNGNQRRVPEINTSTSSKENLFLKNFQNNASAISSLAGNDTFAGATNVIKAGGGTIADIGKSILSTDKKSALGGILSSFGLTGTALAALFRTINAGASGFEKTLVNQDKLVTTYANPSRDGNIHGNDLRNRALAWNKGTGLDSETFLGYANSLGKYGIGNSENSVNENIDKASQLTNTAAWWSHNTNGDVNTMLNLVGTEERYGRSGDQTLFEHLYGSATAQGYSKGQFNDYIEGISGIVQEGLSKGFIKSAKDVSDQITNLTLSSGNSEYWKGETGIQHFTQMSNAMGSNTSLDNTDSMLMFQTMKKIHPNMSWTEILRKMEEGDMSPEFLQAYGETLTNSFHGDTDSILSSIQKTYHTTWQGAYELYDSIYGKKVNVDEEAKNNYSDPSYTTDLTHTQDEKNDIDRAKTNVEQVPFESKYNKLLDLLDKLVNWLDRGTIGIEEAQ